MGARVMTLWYFLQGIIEICLCQNKKCHFILFFARENEGQQNNRILIPSFCLRLPYKNDENIAAAKARRGGHAPGVPTIIFD